MSHDVVAVKVS